LQKLPELLAIQFAKIREKIGFSCKRQKGSHMFIAHPDGRTTVVQNHPSEKLDRMLLNKIIKHDIKITREELSEYL
jgi:predicted RNA binding protein YcfA (HicA-like mRNA interferase family)